MLTSAKHIILDAKEGGYAVGCFNTSDLEITKAIVAAAQAQRSPVIISTSEKAIEYAGLETLAAIIKEEAQNVSVPVALHLDHGKSLEMVRSCLKEGYSSVMFDGSSFEYGKNVELTRQAVEAASTQHVPCEGEVGTMGKAGESQSRMTDPEEAVNFAVATKVDWLAISFGSQHGIGGGGSEKLDIDLLKKIKALVSVPLVLHGGSGVSDGDIKAAIQNGICKVNIDTDIRHEFTQELREALKESPNEKDPRKILEEAMRGVQALVERKIRLFGSNNKV